MPLSELTNWNEYVKLFVGLFALVPPPIIVPFFLALTANRTKAESNQMAAISSVKMCGVILSSPSFYFSPSLLSILNFLPILALHP